MNIILNIWSTVSFRFSILSLRKLLFDRLFLFNRKPIINKINIELIRRLCLITTIIIIASPLHAQIFSDDFSIDIGWTNETNGDFVISGGQLNWNVDRDIVQKMYVPIDPYTGDFQLEFDFQMTDRENNSWLDVGLAESLNGALADPTNDPVGTFVSCGWLGGGTSYSAYFVIPRVWYSDQDAYGGGFDYTDPSTYATFTEDAWYNVKLEVVGLNWRITLTNASGEQVDQTTGVFPYAAGTYNYIYIGSSEDTDWPEANGYLDNLSVSDQVDWDPNTVTGIGYEPFQQIKIFPNPTSSFLFLETLKNINAKIRIIDLSGKILFVRNFYNRTIRIDLSKLETGLYLVIIETGNYSKIEKIVKIN